MTSKTVSITLLKNTYQIKCDEASVPVLEKVSRYLDNTMRQIKQKGPHDFADIAVLAALNIGNELYQHTQKTSIEKQDETSVETTFSDVQARLRKALGISQTELAI